MAFISSSLLLRSLDVAPPSPVLGLFKGRIFWLRVMFDWAAPASPLSLGARSDSPAVARDPTLFWNYSPLADEVPPVFVSLLIAFHFYWREEFMAEKDVLRFCLPALG